MLILMYQRQPKDNKIRYVWSCLSRGNIKGVNSERIYIREEHFFYTFYFCGLEVIEEKNYEKSEQK